MKIRYGLLPTTENQRICHFSSWPNGCIQLSFLKQQNYQSLIVLLCKEALHHTRSKCKRLQEAELSHADMENCITSVVTRCTLALGLPILLSHKQNSGECPHLQLHILDTKSMGQILVTHGQEKEETALWAGWRDGRQPDLRHDRATLNPAKPRLVAREEF